MTGIPDFYDEMGPKSPVFYELFKDTLLKEVEGVPNVIDVLMDPKSPKNFTELATMLLREKAFGGFKRGEMMIYCAGSPSQQIKTDFARSIMGRPIEGFQYLTNDSYAYADYQLRKDFDIFPLSAKEPSVSEVCRKNWVSVLLQKGRQ